MDRCEGFYLGEATSQLKKAKEMGRSKIKMLQNKAAAKCLNYQQNDRGKPHVKGTVQSEPQEVFRRVNHLYC